VELINFLFEDYSKRNLTKKTDRCVAAVGLENRIAKAMNCESRYGIFQKFFHRNILWQAADDKTERIAYDDNEQVPSWSWMAYSGGIRFKDITVGSVEWVDNLQFDKKRKSALITDVGKFWNCCTLEPDGNRYAIFKFVGRKRGRIRYNVGWIQYDVGKVKKLRQKRCVVVGRTTEHGSKEEYYILVVVPTIRDNEYTRVGIGEIQCGHVKRWKNNMRVV